MTIQDTDKFLVSRGGKSYWIMASDLKSLKKPFAPEKHFNAVSYSGNNGASQKLTGIGFEPDFVWMKGRNQTLSHAWFDQARGVNKFLTSNGVGAEITNNPHGYLSSFDADGYTVTKGSSSANETHGPYNYIGWCWKAGPTSTNTTGSVTSTTMVNEEAGFSMVTFPKTASKQETIGHGLNGTPALIILKERNANARWWAYHPIIWTQTGRIIQFDNFAGGVVDTNLFPVKPDSSVVTLGTGFGASNVIMYCFKEIPNFTKIGEYTGNGNASAGPIVDVGFKPRWIMVKNHTSGEQANWVVHDVWRSPQNPARKSLYPNTNVQEPGDTDASRQINWTDTGFQVLTNNIELNKLNSKYAYFAIA